MAERTSTLQRSFLLRPPPAKSAAAQSCHAASGVPGRRSPSHLVPRPEKYRGRKRLWTALTASSRLQRRHNARGTNKVPRNAATFRRRPYGCFAPSYVFASLIAGEFFNCVFDIAGRAGALGNPRIEKMRSNGMPGGLCGQASDSCFNYLK